MQRNYQHLREQFVGAVDEVDFHNAQSGAVSEQERTYIHSLRGHLTSPRLDGMGRFSKRTVGDVSGLLQPGEVLLGEPVAVERTTDDHGGVDFASIREVGVLALTSHRVIFVGQILLTQTCITAPLARVWSVSHDKSWSGQTLTVNMDGRWETFTPTWGDRRRLMSFARDVHMAATRAAQGGEPTGSSGHLG